MNGRHKHTTAEASLYDGQEVFMWYDFLLDLTRTSSLVTWSLYEMCSILRQHLISMACILLWSSPVRVHDSQAYRKIDVSQAYRKIDVTRERISCILELREILLSI